MVRWKKVWTGNRDTLVEVVKCLKGHSLEVLISEEDLFDHVSVAVPSDRVNKGIMMIDKHFATKAYYMEGQ